MGTSDLGQGSNLDWVSLEEIREIIQEKDPETALTDRGYSAATIKALLSAMGRGTAPTARDAETGEEEFDTLGALEVLGQWMGLF